MLDVEDPQEEPEHDELRAADGTHRRRRGDRVITSYSIHYTKLYDAADDGDSLAGALARCRRLNPALTERALDDVELVLLDRDRVDVDRQGAP